MVAFGGSRSSFEEIGLTMISARVKLVTASWQTLLTLVGSPVMLSSDRGDSWVRIGAVRGFGPFAWRTDPQSLEPEVYGVRATQQRSARAAITADTAGAIG